MYTTHVRMLALAAAATLACGAAQADNDYRVTVNTTVYSTDTQTGIRDLMPDGAPAQLSFMVDSSNYLNHGTYPTRGYVIDMSTLSFTVNGLALTLDAPTDSSGNVIPMYFAMRNNDPKVDGVYLGSTVGGDGSFSVHVPGSSLDFLFNYHQTWSGGNQFSSLNIGENTGTWGAANLSVYQFNLELAGGYDAAEFDVPTITISAVPEPTTVALMALGGLGILGAVRRRRQQA